MTTTSKTLSEREEGGEKTKNFLFPLVPVNSYALDEVSFVNASSNTTNNTITTKNATNEEDEKKANMLPIFTLQPLKKQHNTDDGENNNTFIKKYGQPTCGMSADDRVFVGTNRGNLLRVNFVEGRTDVLGFNNTLKVVSEEDEEMMLRGGAFNDNEEEEKKEDLKEGTTGSVGENKTAKRKGLANLLLARNPLGINANQNEIGKVVCARGDACAFTAKDGKTGKVVETHYLGGQDWERSKAIGKLRGVSVSCGCWASSSSSCDGSDGRGRGVGGEEGEEESSSDSEDEGKTTTRSSYEKDYDMDDDDGTNAPRNNNNAKKPKAAKKNLKGEKKTKVKRELLLGTSTGSIVYLELEEGKEDWKRMREVKCVPVLDIPKESGLSEPIVGVKLYSTKTTSLTLSREPQKPALSKLLSSGKSNNVDDGQKKKKGKTKFYSLMVATPSRLFFVKKEARSIEHFFDELKKSENQALLEPVVRMPVRASTSSLATKRNASTEEIVFAWLTGAGVYAGSADASAKETDNQAKLLRDHSLLPFPTKNALRKKEDSSPIGLALTDHHAVLTYADRIACISRLTGELAQLLRLDETADGIVTRESLIASKVVFCATDDITGVSYLCTDNGDLSEIASRDEARDAWRYYCERNEFKRALQCVGMDARRRFEIFKTKAEKAFKDREYELAGQAWAQCEEMVPFERIAKKFKDVGSLHGLIAYCVGRYEKLNKVALLPGGGVLVSGIGSGKSETSGGKGAAKKSGSNINVDGGGKDNKNAQQKSAVDEDAAKRSMLANFLVDLHLSAIQRAEEKGKHVLETRLKFAAFLRQFKRDIDTQLTKRKIEKTSDRDLEVSFASAQGEHEKVIAYFLDEKRDIDLTLDALANVEVPSELICDSIEKCFELNPEKTTDFLIRQGTRRVEPKRVLYAFTPFVGSKDENAVENAIRYLRRACAEPNVSSSAARDLASHNLLTTLYVESLANGFREELFQELESYLREAVRSEEVESFGTREENFFEVAVANATGNNAKRNQFAYYDPRYALTLLESRMDKKVAYKCVAFLHCLLKEYEEAIRAALEHGNDVELAKTIADAPVSNSYDFDGGINHAYFGGSGGVGNKKSKTSLLLKEMQKKLAIRHESDEDESSEDEDEDEDTSDEGESDSEIEREETAHLRRKTLWLEIAKHVIDNCAPPDSKENVNQESLVEQKVKVALKFLKETTKDNNVREQRSGGQGAEKDNATRILGVEDILPLLPDFTKIDAVRDAVLEALHKYQNAIETMKKDIERDSEITALVREQVRQIQSKDLEIDAEEPCATCKKPVLRNGKVPDSSDCAKLAPFYAFPCTHAFHCACLLREALPLMLDDERNQCLSLMKCLKIPLPIRLKPKVKLWGPPPKTATGHTAESAVEKLEDVLCQECPMCGIMRTRIIDEPLFHLPEEQEEYDAWNFEDKYTFEFEQDALRFVSRDANENDAAKEYEEEEEEEEEVIQIVDGHKILSGYAEIFDELPGLAPVMQTWDRYVFHDSSDEDDTKKKDDSSSDEEYYYYHHSQVSR